MNFETLKAAALSICTLPTAPFHEHHVRAEVERRLSRLPSVRLSRDAYGNVLACYRRGSKRHPIGLVAHMDHPGFGVSIHRGKRRLELLGGVREPCLAGQAIEFFNRESTDALGTTRLTGTDWKRERKWVDCEHKIPAEAEFAMWKLPPGNFRRAKYLGRVCDDLCSVATIVALIETLAHEQVPGEVWGLITRAEEVGFFGALASLRSRKSIPPHVPLISLETSQARGFAEMGKGPILRVGDRTSIFTPEVTMWLQDGLSAFAKSRGEDENTGFQRLLMAGGTCEATVFAQAGLPCGGMCLALDNYHNMTPQLSIGLEAVDRRDWQRLFDFLVHLATHGPRFEAAKKGLSERLRKLQAEALLSLKEKS